MKKTALVTGGTKGIGLAIVSTLLSDGYRVVATYSIDEKAAEEADRQLQKKYLDYVIQKSDVSDSYAVKAIVEKTVARFGGIDVLVNNAGILKQQEVFELSEADWDRTFAVNLKGPFLLSQLVMPLMQKRGGGVVVNISSVGGQTGGPKAPDYAASKAALICFTQSMARHGAEMNVRVNCVSPGWIDTGIFSKERYMEIQAEAQKYIPLARLGQPQEVADAVSFLVSDKATYITGQTLNVNGGLYFS